MPCLTRRAPGGPACGRPRRTITKKIRCCPGWRSRTASSPSKTCSAPGPHPGLFVLSGCVTGMSKRRPGDELIGLAQAALRSGTRSVVATLWETFDESSTLFFEHFYDAHTRGVTVSQAIA